MEILFDMSCTGLARRLPVDPDNLMSSYAWAILNQVPCMRMVNASGRDRYIDGFRDRLDGIICHTVKFCDMYSFEYAHLKEDAHLPVLQVETDMTAQSEGQIRTRVEAFLESLVKKPRHKESNPQNSYKTEVEDVCVRRGQRIDLYKCGHSGRRPQYCCL